MAEDLVRRTRRFAVNIIEFCSTFPRRRASQVIEQQLLRSATSVGSNYREARRAQSLRAFLAKLSIVEGEADESLFWLELAEEIGIGDGHKLRELKEEANQLVAIVVASKKTARRSTSQKPQLYPSR